MGVRLYSNEEDKSENTHRSAQERLVVINFVFIAYA